MKPPTGNGWGSSFLLGIEMNNFEDISQRIMDVFPHDAPELPLHCTKTARGSLSQGQPGQHIEIPSYNFQAAME